MEEVEDRKEHDETLSCGSGVDVALPNSQQR